MILFLLCSPVRCFDFEFRRREVIVDVGSTVGFLWERERGLTGQGEVKAFLQADGARQ